MAKLKGSNPYCIGNLIEDPSDGPFYGEKFIVLILIVLET